MEYLEIDDKTVEELKTIIKKSDEYLPLTSREISMLFFWSRNRDNPSLEEVTNFANKLEKSHKQKRKYYFRRKKNSE